jgi:hypothetical protein
VVCAAGSGHCWGAVWRWTKREERRLGRLWDS